MNKPITINDYCRLICEDYKKDLQKENLTDNQVNELCDDLYYSLIDLPFKYLLIIFNHLNF